MSISLSALFLQSTNYDQRQDLVKAIYAIVPHLKPEIIFADVEGPSGSSLITMYHSVVEEIEDEIEDANPDCDQIEEEPSNIITYKDGDNSGYKEDTCECHWNMNGYHCALCHGMNKCCFCSEPIDPGNWK